MAVYHISAYRCGGYEAVKAFLQQNGIGPASSVFLYLPAGNHIRGFPCLPVHSVFQTASCSPCLSLSWRGAGTKVSDLASIPGKDPAASSQGHEDIRRCPVVQRQAENLQYVNYSPTDQIVVRFLWQFPSAVRLRTDDPE